MGIKKERKGPAVSADLFTPFVIVRTGVLKQAAAALRLKVFSF